MPILIGAIVGGLVLLLLIGLAIVCFVRRRHQQRHVREASAAADYFADLPTAPIQQQSEYESVHSALGLGAATTGTTATYAAAVPDTIHYGSGHMQVVYNTVPADRSSSSHYIAVTDNELLPE